MIVKRMARVAAAAAMCGWAHAGCSLFSGLLGVSVTQRITQFQTDLNNADRTNIYLNFDSTKTTEYNAIKDPKYWDTPYPVPAAGDQKYAITITDDSDPSNVTATMAGPASFSASGSALSAVFVMSQEGFDYFIRTLDVSQGTTLYNEIKRIR